MAIYTFTTDDAQEEALQAKIVDLNKTARTPYTSESFLTQLISDYFNQFVEWNVQQKPQRLKDAMDGLSPSDKARIPSDIQDILGI